MTTTVNPYPTATADTASNAPGRASLILAAVIVAVGIVQQVTVQLVPLIMRDSGFSAAQIGIVFGAFGGVVGILAIIGLVLGLLGLSRPGAPKAAAGAGTGVAASALVSVVVSFVLPLVIGALY